MDGNFKLPIALSLLGIVLIIGGVFASGLTKSKPKDLPAGRQDYPKESLVTQDKVISVDVSGAVNKPGVYQLKDGSRIEDAIKMAGSFSQTANQEYISKYLNMAQKLSDGSKVYIPLEGEQVPSGAGTQAVAGTAIQTKVNINTASESELDTLSGVGPVTASKIISGRPYQSIDELISKKILSKSVFDKIKDQLVLY